jgi:hypothetical protein
LPVCVHLSARGHEGKACKPRQHLGYTFGVFRWQTFRPSPGLGQRRAPEEHRPRMACKGLCQARRFAKSTPQMCSPSSDEVWYERL